MSALDTGPASTACPKCHTLTARYLRLIGGRECWCWPGGDDGETCSRCWEEDVAVREMARREECQAAAGIPPLYRGPSILAGYEAQGKEEQDYDSPKGPVTNGRFILRVRDAREKDATAWGVSRLDIAALRLLKGWRPSMGSIYIEGAPGTGKSMAACALANDLCSAPTTYVCVCAPCERRWREGLTYAALDSPWLGVAQSEHKGPYPARLRVQGPRQVRFQSESRLISTLRRPDDGGWEKKKDQRQLCAEAGVLVLDDVGSAEAFKPWHQDVMLELIDDRYVSARPRKPTIFTSNIPLAKLHERYGERLASRVREIVGARRVEFRTVWR